MNCFCVSPEFKYFLGKLLVILKLLIKICKTVLSLFVSTIKIPIVFQNYLELQLNNMKILRLKKVLKI